MTERIKSSWQMTIEGLRTVERKWETDLRFGIYELRLKGINRTLIFTDKDG
ncbi:MAG: hypothetical protein ACUZ9M_02520 [Candidatus Scalindua sp.]